MRGKETAVEATPSFFLFDLLAQRFQEVRGVARKPTIEKLSSAFKRFSLALNDLISTSGLRLTLVTMAIFLAAIPSSLAWNEQELLGDWETKEGLQVFRFNSDHTFELRDGIGFDSYSGTFDKTDDELKLTIRTTDTLLSLTKLTDSELILHNVNQPTDLDLKRRPTSVTQIADELRSLGGFRLGMDSADIFVKIKRQNLPLIEQQQGFDDNVLRASKYSLYSYNSGKIIIAKRLSIRIPEEEEVRIDFYPNPVGGMQTNPLTPSEANFNIAIRIENTRTYIKTRPSMAELSRQYIDKFGKPWLESEDSATWYITPKGVAPSMITRTFSNKCSLFEVYRGITEMFIENGGDKTEPEHCGISLAIEIRKGMGMITADKDGKLIDEKTTDVVTTIFDYDLIRRVALARYRNSRKK
jgi:hypothetical protein